MTHREISSVNESSQSHLAPLVDGKKRKVTVIKEENGLDALVCF
jgi:hypothetical protein